MTQPILKNLPSIEEIESAMDQGDKEEDQKNE